MPNIVRSYSNVTKVYSEMVVKLPNTKVVTFESEQTIHASISNDNVNDTYSMNSHNYLSANLASLKNTDVFNG